VRHSIFYGVEFLRRRWVGLLVNSSFLGIADDTFFLLD
jgi:hypothetical protein